MFDLFYKKNNNEKLFAYLEKSGFKYTQNYIPLFSTFFSIDDKNYNSINLNHSWYISSIVDRETNNKFTIKCKNINDNKNIQKKQAFFKFSPLLDPIKFLVGKYKNLDEKIRISLPKTQNNCCHSKVLDTNNAAYVDSFFSYLTSKLLNEKKFIHGTDFYGSFLSVQNKFKVNIYDDLEYLYDSDFFHKNKNILFNTDDVDEGKLLDNDTRNYRKKIKLEKSLNNLKVQKIDNSIFENIFELTSENLRKHDESLKEEYSNTNVLKNRNKKNINTNKSTKRTSSTCSSRSSNTNGSSNSDQSAKLSDKSCTNSDMSGYSSINSDEVVNTDIFNFPIQIICLEQMENTLDSLLEDEDKELSNGEWSSCLFQIIMILITYQKIFDFTHNDLHTNNIMYIETNRMYINYNYNNTYYRVPTYGKIYKIIDFGRSIYKFKGKIICSDSYHPKGDAATQYNFEPYFNENKPRLNPNKSFDLCRLACSLYDYFAEDIIENTKDPIAKLIIEWTKDDKDRNILYKNNGEERYPDFKLYKMIVRTVHNHIPEKQLKKEIFKKYISSKRKIKNGKIINIDIMESMIN